MNHPENDTGGKLTASASYSLTESAGLPRELLDVMIGDTPFDAFLLHYG